MHSRISSIRLSRIFVGRNGSEIEGRAAPVSGDDEHISWRTRIDVLWDIVPPAALIVAVLGSIFAGIATPVEAGAIGALGAFMILVLYGRLSLETLKGSCLQTLKIAGMSTWILIAAILFGVLYTTTGAQSAISEFITSLQVNPWVVILVMQLILLAFGMFMDDYAIVTICAPILLPIAVGLGFDPIWFSIVFILNIQVAYLTPPLGWALLMMKGIAPTGVTTRDIWASVPPFVAIQLFVLILVMLFPDLALWLPNNVF